MYVIIGWVLGVEMYFFQYSKYNRIDDNYNQHLSSPWAQ